MTDFSLPTVTVVIPAKPTAVDLPAVEAARCLDYPTGKLELLIVRGTQPSAQRNLAVRQATGELIYFLDNDSIPGRDVLLKGAKHFANSSVQVVGGPNLCPADAPRLERIFALTMASWIAFGPSRARYAKVGTVRSSSEKELILCNMLMRREVLLRHNGFDEALYPNEENALMEDIAREGGQLIYDPDFYVFRRPRRTVAAFLKMLMTYGRGRAEQFRLHPGPGSALNFIPPGFCLFILATPFFPILSAPFWGVYFLLLLVQAFSLSGGILKLAVLPFLFCSHLFYGLGFWRGLFTRLTPPSASLRDTLKIEVIRR